MSREPSKVYSLLPPTFRLRIRCGKNEWVLQSKSMFRKSLPYAEGGWTEEVAGSPQVSYVFLNKQDDCS